MRFLITSGPTYEPLDQVRRLTNFSTGSLGAELANHFTAQGHQVTLLRGHYSTYAGPCSAQEIVTFSTTADLLARLKECAAASAQAFNAVLHAAAVSDFVFGQVYREGENGLERITAGKFSSRIGKLLTELVPAPKILPALPGLFPKAKIVGWKYEVDGTPETALAAARQQLREARVHFCVVNGPAYKAGFGLVSPDSLLFHADNSMELAEKLLRIAQ